MPPNCNYTKRCTTFIELYADDHHHQCWTQQYLTEGGANREELARHPQIRHPYIPTPFSLDSLAVLSTVCYGCDLESTEVRSASAQPPHCANIPSGPPCKRGRAFHNQRIESTISPSPQVTTGVYNAVYAAFIYQLLHYIIDVCVHVLQSSSRIHFPIKVCGLHDQNTGLNKDVEGNALYCAERNSLLTTRTSCTRGSRRSGSTFVSPVKAISI